VTLRSFIGRGGERGAESFTLLICVFGSPIISLKSFRSEFADPETGLLHRQVMAPEVGLVEPLLGNFRCSQQIEGDGLFGFFPQVPSLIQVCELTFEVNT